MLTSNCRFKKEILAQTIRKSRWWVCTIVCGLLVAMTGCGGGGGGGGGSDTTAPQVDSTSPVNGAADVALGTAITVTFNEAMNDATISTASFSVDNGVTGTVSYNSNNHTATFVPAVDLTPSTVYTATVSTSCTDMAGNPMAADITWTFTTGTASAPGWTSLGGQIDPGGAESQDPTMLIVNDMPMVGYRYASFEIHLYQWNGTDWASAGPDPSNGNANSSIYHTPSFCTDGSTVYMAFSDAGDGGSSGPDFYDRIFVYKWTDTGGYAVMNGGNEVSIPESATYGGASAWEPAIAWGGSGDPWMAWVEADVVPSPDTEDGLWVARVSDGSAARSTILSRNNTSATYFTDVRTVGLAVDDSGTAYAAQWESHDSDQDRTDLYVSAYNGSTFTPLGGAVTDDYDYNNLCKPSMAFSGGDVYIAYARANSSDYTKHVYVKRFNSGSNTWDLVGGGPVSAFSPSDHYDSADPDLIAANGTLYVAWQESDQYDGPFIFVAHYDAGSSSWVIDGDRLNADTANAALDPSLAFLDDAVDYLYVAFEEYTDGWPHIFVKRKQLIP